MSPTTGLGLREREEENKVNCKLGCVCVISGSLALLWSVLCSQVTHLYTKGDVCDVTGASRQCQVKFKLVVKTPPSPI